MKLRDVVESWEQSAGERRSRECYSIRLPVHDAAKVAALAEMYPGRSEQDIITDLLSAALDEVEAAFPYIQGSRVVAEDEHGDPLYEDEGLTPRFQALTRKHLQRLEETAEE
jgi:hypothetical protein